MSSSSSDEGSHQEEDRPSKKIKTNFNSEAALSSIPLDVSSQDTAIFKKSKSPPIIILLDQATLETVKDKRGIYELLNCDDHRDICKKKLHQDPNMYRPDIVHQELLSLSNVTLISILHRTKHLKKFDFNLVVEDGKIVRIEKN